MKQSVKVHSLFFKLKKTVPILFTIFRILTGIAYSQKNDTVSLDKLLEMPLSELADLKVVTASKTPRFASEITQKVDIVTEKQKDKIISGNRNIAELIQYLPGASIKVLSRNDANWGAYGGTGSKYCTYMIQGLPIDGFVDQMSLDVIAIKKIEVQRGPASVLYPNYLSQDFAGNQSPLGGTVNIILKGHTTEKPLNSVFFGYGFYKTYDGNAFIFINSSILPVS
jgi:outer membrane receptor protein involved in Fe transport